MKYNELFDLSDDVVLQLGFTGPIGRQFSSVFAESGCVLILGDCNEKEGVKLAGELKEVNNKVEYIKMDVSNEDDVVKTIEYVENEHKGISVLVNCFSRRPAGFYDKFELSDSESWQDVMSVNLSAVYFSCREVSKLMIKQGQGSIINVASIAGVVAPDKRVYGNSGLNSPAVYTASKSGVIGLTKYLAAYLGEYNIRVNCISPAGVDPGNVDREFVKNYSQKIPLARMANMGDMKGSVIFLASRASEYVTGHNLIVDGGLSIW